MSARGLAPRRLWRRLSQAAARASIDAASETARSRSRPGTGCLFRFVQVTTTFTVVTAGYRTVSHCQPIGKTAMGSEPEHVQFLHLRQESQDEGGGQAWLSGSPPASSLRPSPYRAMSRPDPHVCSSGV